MNHGNSRMKEVSDQTTSAFSNCEIVTNSYLRARKSYFKADEWESELAILTTIL